MVFPIGSFFDGKGRDRKEKDKIEGSGSEALGASETEASGVLLPLSC